MTMTPTTPNQTVTPEQTVTPNQTVTPDQTRPHLTRPDQTPDPSAASQSHAGSIHPARQSGRRGRRVAASVVLVGLLGVAGYVGYDQLTDGATGEETANGSTGGDLEPAASYTTAAVEIRDLVETKRLNGTLGYDTAITVVNRADGTVSTAPKAGVAVQRGDELLRIDGRPTVAFYGESAAWRELRSGVSSGADIRQLEENLSALGHDPDNKLTIDNKWNSATTAAVKRWQRAIGVTDDGTVRLSDVVFLPGPGQITGVEAIRGAGVGDGSAVLSYQPHQDSDAVVSRRKGNVSELPAIGTDVVAGTPLIAVNTKTTYALIADDVQNSRTLKAGVSDGTDIKALEENLVAMGHDPNSTITVDQKWDTATTDAVKRWQASLDLDQTGTTTPELFAFVEPDSVVTNHIVKVGDELSGQAATIEVGRSRRRIDSTIGVGDQNLVAVGTPVNVSVDGGAASPGVITEVATNATSDESGGAEIALRIEADDPAAFGDLVAAPVRVTVESKRTDGVLAVPTASLVGLVGGGHAVEVVAEDGSRQLYAVELGESADGWIEITAGSIAEGQMVVLPL